MPFILFSSPPPPPPPDFRYFRSSLGTPCMYFILLCLFFSFPFSFPCFLFFWRPVCCVWLRVHSLSLCALPVSSSFLFFSCLSSVDHVVTGPSPWFAFALVCHGPGPWFDVRSTSKYVYGYG
ncbi:unnamed protein product [Pylaiella littoralis]